MSKYIRVFYVLSSTRQSNLLPNNLRYQNRSKVNTNHLNTPRNYPKLDQDILAHSIFSPIIVIFLALFFTLFFTPTYALQTLYSPSYQVQMSNLNMGAGTSNSTSFTVNQTMGQSIQGEFDSAGYKVLAGFQYINPFIPFTFTLNSVDINFGSLVPNTPSTQTNTLRVTSGSAHGYTVQVIADHALRLTNGSATIPNTTCNLSLTCSTTDATPWTDSSAYGFGYNMTGTDVDTADFVNNTYYRPFPIQGTDSPAIVMERSTIATDSAAVTTYKLNIDGTQDAGTYSNSLQYIAIPSF